MKVRANSFYYFYPILWDIIDPCYGVSHKLVEKGDRVKVVNQYGCPKANTMGHCYIEKDGTFIGLVHTNSLQKTRIPEER